MRDCPLAVNERMQRILRRGEWGELLLVSGVQGPFLHCVIFSQAVESWRALIRRQYMLVIVGTTAGDGEGEGDDVLTSQG